MKPANVSIKVTLEVDGQAYNEHYGRVVREVKGEIDPESAGATLTESVHAALADCIAAIDQTLAFKAAEERYV